MCDFAIEIVRYYCSLYFARRCFLSVLSNHSWVFPPLFGPAVFPAVRKLRAMMFVVYMFIAIGQQRTFTFGRAKRIPCESAGETPNGITYTSTHQRIVLAVRPVIFEVRSSGLILWTHVTTSDYVGNILVSNAAKKQRFWANFALWKLVSM